MRATHSAARGGSSSAEHAAGEVRGGEVADGCAARASMRVERDAGQHDLGLVGEQELERAGAR